MVVTLSLTFLTGLIIKISTLCRTVHLLNSSNIMDKFKDILYNLSHTQNMSSSFIPE